MSNVDQLLEQERHLSSDLFRADEEAYLLREELDRVRDDLRKALRESIQANSAHLQEVSSKR